MEVSVIIAPYTQGCLRATEYRLDCASLWTCDRSDCFCLFPAVQVACDNPFNQGVGGNDPADTNHDGSVSAAERLTYELSHPIANSPDE